MEKPINIIQKPLTIWLASSNMNKKNELAAILAFHGCQCKILTPSSAGLNFDPDETEKTFAGNALLKAKTLYSMLEQNRPALYICGDPIIADDSGICVDSLKGRPGILSARYTGSQEHQKQMNASETESGSQKLSARDRNILLLEELGDKQNRNARFVCAMVLLFTPYRFYMVQETCEGEIVKNIRSSKGKGGFGYDPVFFIPEQGKTMAQLSDDEKNKISHRGKAGKIIARMLL